MYSSYFDTLVDCLMLCSWVVMALQRQIAAPRGRNEGGSLSVLFQLWE